MDWQELFANRDQYPDDTVVEGPTGAKLSLGELRKQFGRLADFTKRTQELAEERQRAAQQAQQLQERLAQYERAIAERDALVRAAQTQLAGLMQQRGTDARQARADDLSAFREDPTFAPLVSLIENQRQTIDQLRQAQQRLEQRLQHDEVAVNAWRLQQQLDRLRAEDPEFKPDEFARFAQEFYTKGLDVDNLYKVYAFDRLVERRAKEAEQKALEKARQERPAPPMPTGRVRGQSSTTPPLPKSLDERLQLAAQDPEILEGLEVGLAELGGGG